MNPPTAPNLLVLLIVGCIVGAIAGRVVLGHGFGIIADTVIGIAGAVIGGVLFHYLNASGRVYVDPFLDYVVIAFIGAVILLALIRLVTPGRSHPSRR